MRDLKPADAMNGVEQGTEIAAGLILADTYEIVRLIGRGGMGAVWEAHNVRLPGKRVAVKFLHATYADDEPLLLRFRREAEIATRLGHPNIVEVHDFNVLPSGVPYILMEHLEGEDLSKRIKRGPMPLDEVVALVRQIGSGLRAAHAENVVHRDLKPQNVFLAWAGDSAEVVKVLDFGISKIRGSSTIKTHAAVMLGTPQYMSPEQASGDHAAVDCRTDIFALGALTYEMLCGYPAFVGHSVPEVVFKVAYEEPPALDERAPSLPPPVVAAVHKALAKRQDDRFPDVDHFIEALTGAPLATMRYKRASLPDGDGPAAGGGDGTAATVQSGKRPKALLTKETAAATPKKLGGRVEGDEPQPSTAANTASAARSESRATATRSLRGRQRWGVVLAAGLAVATASVFVSRARPVAGPEHRGPELMSAAGASTESRRAPARLLDEQSDGAVAGASDAGGAASATIEADAESIKIAASEGPANTPAAERSGANERTRAEPSRSTSRATERADDSAMSDEVRQALSAAEAALREGDYARAIHLTNRAERRQVTMRGISIRTRAHCGQHDLRNARANWRRLSAHAREHVSAYCKGFDIIL
jgi:eukaryotic-like serine/threonine-protein kinase